MGRRTSELAILPAAGILATHYVKVYMPEEGATIDQDQRITIDSLEEYLLSASPSLSLVAGAVLGPDPFAGALFLNGSYGSFIGIQDSGTPSIGAYQENLSTGAVGQITLQDGFWGISVNDGGVVGYSLQESFNTSAGVRQLSLYDPSSTIIDEFGVTSGSPYHSLTLDDSVDSYYIEMQSTYWKVYGSQSNISLVNSDSSDFGGMPFAGAIAVNGFITAIAGIYDSAIGDGAYTATLEYFDSDNGIVNYVLVDSTTVCLYSTYDISMFGQTIGMTATVSASEAKWIVDSSGIICVTHNSNTLLIDELNGNIRLYKAHNNSMAYGNASNPELRSGSDTSAPTVTGTVNITGVASATNHKFARIGNEVIGSFRVQIDPAVGATASQLRFTLPIPSTLTLPGDVSGIAHCASIDKGGEITADTVNGAAYLDFISDAVSAAKTWTIFYQYTIK